MTDLRQRASELPLEPGVYLYKDAHGTVIYVGKAVNLRNRVRSYFSADKMSDMKTGTLLGEAREIDFIQVDNNREALALENNLIKQYKPRFNVLLRDDKTYPYIKLTGEKFPRVYVTRRLKKDGSSYFGPYFPASLAYRLVNLIHRYFKVPSCRIDMARTHTQPCLEYHIHRCLGPCVAALTTEKDFGDAVQSVRLFLDGRHTDLARDLDARMNAASAAMRYEEAAALHELKQTVEDLGEKQKMASVEGADTDIFGYHAEEPLVAVNLFHFRNARVVDRREFFWEDQRGFDPAEFFSSLVKQLYLDEPHIPAQIHVPVDFDDRELLEELLSVKRGRKVEIHTPQRGSKKAMLDLVESNAQLSFEQRFRVLKPSAKAIEGALQDALSLEQAPRRIECFDISHIQGTDKVASMVVWENGKMKKADYRKFIIKTVEGNDDFASMREVITRRYQRLKEEGKDRPGLVLVDGGLGQLHAAADALESLGITDQPLASIAKRDEWIYVYGQEEEPIVLDKFSPVLHLIQMVRDEAHRFAVTFHRTRRNASRLRSELDRIPGVGEKTVTKLLRHFGSVELVRQAPEDELAKVAGTAIARKIKVGIAEDEPAAHPMNEDTRGAPTS